VHIEPVQVPESVAPSSFAQPGRAQSLDPGFVEQSNVFLELFLQLRQRASEFDLVHSHAFDYPAFACSALLTTIPVVHTVHLPAVSPEINNVLKIFDQQGHPLTLVTVSHACAQDYAAYSSFDHIIYNGLALEAIPFAAEVEQDAALLFAGRITPEKGVEEAIEIAERANCHLVLAGGIYDRAYYEERVLPRLRRAGERVLYTGQLDHATLWKRMSEAKALLFPIAWDEPFGLTPVEAMAAGTPVIAFRRGAMEEIIQPGRTGFLVDPGDCVQAAAVVECLDEISRADCRAHVEAYFSQRHMLDAYEQLYASLAGQV
jgi:glycosyltransferase involved in cell wall biosynthesis